MADTIRVKITYSKDKWDVGKVRTLPADEARLLIREGRAQAYDGPTDEDGYATPTVVTVVPPEQASPARQAEQSETPAPADQPAKPSTRRRADTPPPAPAG